LIAGTAAIPLVWALGRATVGNATGLLAAPLMALSPFALFYSVEARAYVLLMAILAASTLVLLRAVEGDRRWLAVYAALAAAALYTHYTAAFVLAAQAGWAIWAHRDRLLPLLVANALAVLAFLPWVPFLLEDADSSTQQFNQALAPLSASALADALATWSVGSPFTDLLEVPGAVATVLIAVGLALAAGFGAARPRELRRGPAPRPELVLLVVVALASPVGAVLYSLGGSSFLPRNLVGSLPALLVLAAALILRAPRPVAVAATALVVAGFALGALAALDPARARPDYRGAAELLDARLEPGRPVLEYLPIPTRSPAARALEINLERAHPLFRAGFDAGERRAVAAARGGGLAVVVAGKQGARRSPLEARAAGLRLVGRDTFEGLEPVTVYRYEFDR
jgi:uncharacterized membrane protein